MDTHTFWYMAHAEQIENTRKYILSIKVPFRVSDILIWAKRNDIKEDIIFKTMDDLRDQGLIEYFEMESDSWAYKVKFGLK